MTRGIYLDNNMATRPSIQTITKMMPFYTDHWGNPSSPHQMGQELFPALTEAYKSIYKMLGARESDGFVFTSSGAEAINQVFLSSYFDITRATGKNQYITANIEEAPILMSISRLELLGCTGKMVDANRKGVITAEAIEKVITPRTALVSLSWANGLTGVIQPVAEIAKLCQDKGIPLHLDATHVLGKLFFELNEINPAFITFNGDQIYGPKGTGGLYVKEGVKCSPLLVGGIEQGGHRAGSYNVPGLIGLGNAALETIECRDLICTEVARLRNHLEEGILEGYPEAQVMFKEEERLPHCTAIAFPGIANEALLYALNRKGVYASIGGGSFQQIALVLTGSGVDGIMAQGAISFSLSRETNEDEIDRAIAIIVETAKKLRKLSKDLVN